MSIENLKQYLELGMSGVDVRVVDWLKELTKTTIEQHEEKKPYLYDKEKHIPINSDSVVEVGQVWRHKQDGRQVRINGEYRINGELDGVFWETKEKMMNTHPHSLDDFLDNYELVTMENIMPGEWVENNGTKFEVLDMFEGHIVINYNGDRMAFQKASFTPCLPPVEEQPKLYTQEELEAEKCKAYKEGYDIGHKYGYQRAIEILQLQNH